MSSLTQSQLINEIVAKIISGGRLTTAQNVREVLNDILDSYPNVVDGGFVHQAVLGYSTLLNLSSADPRSFVHKDYVDSVVGQVYTFENGLTESGGVVRLGGDLTQDTTINGGDTRSLLLGNSVGNNNLRRFTVNANLSATINSPTVNLAQQTADSILTLDNAGDVQGITLGASQSIRRNAANNAFEAYTPSTGGQGVQDYNSPLAWFHQFSLGVRGNTVLSANIIYYAPIYFSVARSITDVGAFCFSITAGNNIRIGLYSNVNERPNTRLFDSGSIVSSTQGFKQAVQSYTFAPGMYWMAFICSVNSSWATGSPMLMFDDPTTGALLIGNMFTQNFAFGALPATATPAQANVSTSPLIYMKNA